MPFDNTSPTTPALKLLRDARARIDSPRKWCQGDYSKKGAYCMIGALDRAADHTMFSNDYMRACLALRLATGCLVPEFNDAPTTTHADVMAAFDRAERLLQEAP